MTLLDQLWEVLSTRYYSVYIIRICRLGSVLSTVRNGRRNMLKVLFF